MIIGGCEINHFGNFKLPTVISELDCQLFLNKHFKDIKQSNKLIVNSTFSFHEKNHLLTVFFASKYLEINFLLNSNLLLYKCVTDV